MLRGKVLLVNDKAGDFPSYAGMIAGLGYDVAICDSYEEGARRIETEDFDFVVLNQGGAAFEGRCVLERAMELHRHVPILVVARSLNLHNYLEAMDLGAVDYLERPEPEDLGWALESRLHHPHQLVLRHPTN